MSDSILFLLGTEVGAELSDDYLIRKDPAAIVADLRDSEPPPPPSIPPGGDEPPPSSHLPPSSRVRGPHVPSIFDVVEFGTDLGNKIRVMTQDPRGMREAISNIAVDDRDGPASNRIAVQERIQNRSRIRELADTLVRYRSVGVLNSAYRAPMHVRAAALYRQANAMTWEITEPFPPPPFVIEVVGFNSVFQIAVQAASMREGLMLTPLPPEVVRLRRRWGRRTRAPKGFTIDLRIDDADRTCVIRDVSFMGISCWVNPASESLHPGKEVMSAAITMGEGPPVEARLEVSFVARDAAGRGDLCGMRVIIEKAADRERWREVVSRLLHPTTCAGRGHYQAIWDLYHQAGYFNLSGKDPAHFENLRRCFFKNAERIDAAPDLGCLVVWPEAEKALATIAMLKVYEGSWLVYQLAKRRGDAASGASARQILRDVHLRAYEHAQLDPNLKWHIGYPQVLEPPIWSHSVHYELPRRYTTAGLACVVRFRALEVSCAAPPPDYDKPPPELEIAEAKPSERDAFLRWLRDARPRPYSEAYDLTPERFDLAANKEFWAKSGMSRDRQLRVARVRGRMVAVAILEDAEEGLHLFRLLDVIRPFPMTRDLSLAAPGMDALVESAKGWYRSKGKSAFCCFLEEDDWLTPAMKRTILDMGQADMTILSAQLLPELLEEVAKVTAPRS